MNSLYDEKNSLYSLYDEKNKRTYLFMYNDFQK